MANLTLIDWAKRRDPNDRVAQVANVLAQTNRMLDDMVFVPGNLPTGHRVTIAAGLPEIYFRAFNEGIVTSKGATVQVDEGLATMEARSEVDSDLANLNGDVAAFRESESRLFIEAMNQKLSTTTWYGNAVVDQKSFTGMSARYSLTTAGNGSNIILGGGSTALSQTSIWLICWSDQTVFGIYPKGSSMGLSQRDLGEQTLFNVNGVADTRMQALVEWFQWKAGLVVRDWRYAVRIPNIEVAHFAGLTSTQSPTTFTNILHKMAIAISRIPNPAMGRCAFYLNRTVFSGLMRLAMEKSANGLSITQGLTQFGTPEAMLSFLGYPIRLCDSLVNTEAVVA